MQDYAKLYPSRFRCAAKTSKLSQVKKLLISGLPPEIILLLIAVIILPTDISEALKRH